MSFTAELKRRNVVRVGIAYLLAAWVILQVSDVVLPILEGPDWVDNTILIALLIGLPIAVILAWVYELTPDGVKLEKDVDRSRSTTDVTGRKLDFVIIGVLVVAVTMFALDKFVWSGGQRTPDSPQSIAVLPFLNITADKEHEYFSDGLTEELLNLLVRIPELRVASRTSSFFYKGKDVRMQDVGRDLGVGHVLEGSVRRSGESVRITAQLIDVPTDTHIWSEVWERTLDDIFAIQDEIAKAVVDELRVRLMGDVPRVTATSPEAYSLYLQAGQKMKLRDAASLQEAEVLLQRALEIDERYVPAWLRLADTYAESASADIVNREQFNSQAREVAMQAVRVDPNSVAAVEKLSSIGIGFTNEPGREVFTRNFRIVEPGQDDGSGDAGRMFAPDYYNESIAFFEASIERDPANAVTLHVLGQHYWLARRFAEAATAFQRSIELDPGRGGSHFYLGAALLAGGDTNAALTEMNKESNDGYRLAGRSLVYQAMGDSEGSSRELDALVRLGYRWTYQIAQAYAFRDDSEVAIEWLGRALDRRDASLPLLGGDPFMDNIRDHPEFRDVWSASAESVL